MAGISRSTSCVMAYLMMEYGKTMKQAYEYVKARRNIICPNPGFVKQLISFEMKLRKKKIKSRSENLNGEQQQEEEVKVQKR
jgi:protein-tyrosine phosphatase